VVAADTDLPWPVIGGGGGSSSSSNYLSGSTIGQPVIGSAQSANYALGGGYWYGTLDMDSDGHADPADNCPAWPNPSQALPNWSVPANDSDCDRFTNTIEKYLGTDPTRQCPQDTTSNNEAIDSWPTDMNDNQISNTLDAGQFVFTLNQSNPNHPGPNTNPAFRPRHDFNANGIINTLDVGAYVFVLNKTCTGSGP
jgi:hypothetical protein